MRPTFSLLGLFKKTSPRLQKSSHSEIRPFVMTLTWNIKVNTDGTWMNLGLPQVNSEAQQRATDHSGQICTARSSFEHQRHSPWKTLINSVKTYKVSLEGLGKETAAAALHDPDHMKHVTCCFRAPHAPISSTWKSFLKPPQSTMKPRSSSLKTRKAIRPSSVHPSHALLWPDLSSGSHLGQTGRTHSQPNCN